VLSRMMRNHGGFEHNLQSLRIVEKLEKKYPGFNGLNLSYEVIEGLQKHMSQYRLPLLSGAPYNQPSLEAQLTHLADEIAYYSHDLDDGINLQLLDPASLSELEIWNNVAQAIQVERLPQDEVQPYIIRCIIDLEVEDVIRTSTDAITEAGVRNSADVRRNSEKLIRYSDDMQRMNAQLRAYLRENMYNHPRVAAINAEGCQYLGDVFEAMVANPAQFEAVLPPRLGEEDTIHRRICDYISGMTDRFLIAEHRRLFSRNKTSRS
jgi:dGTPase